MRIIEEAHGLSGLSDMYAAEYDGDLFSAKGQKGAAIRGMLNTPIGIGLTYAAKIELGDDLDRYETLKNSLNTLDKALRYQAINDTFYKSRDGMNPLKATANIANSFFRNALDVSNWDFGVTDIKKALFLNDIRNIQDNGGTYTRE